MNELSQLWSVNVRDFVEGLTAAVIMAVVTTAYQLIASCVTLACVIGINWVSVESAAVVAFIGYIGTKLATAQNGKLFGKI